MTRQHLLVAVVVLALGLGVAHAATAKKSSWLDSAKRAAARAIQVAEEAAAELRGQILITVDDANPNTPSASGVEPYAY